MESILKILVLVVITFSSWVETLNNEAISTINLNDKSRLSGLYCPPMTLKKKHKVVMIYHGREIYGCASIDHNRYLSDSPLFHLWLELPPNSNPEPAYCQNTCKMFPYIYECMSKSEPTNKNEVNRGIKYMSLYQYSPKYKQANTSAIPPYTCVAYVTETYEDHGIMAIRMAVSSGRENSFDVKQCEGLSNMLTNKGDIYDHETQKKWPKGASYVFVMGDLQPKRHTTTTTTTTTTTEKPSLSFYQFFVMVPGELP